MTRNDGNIHKTRKRTSHWLPVIINEMEDNMSQIVPIETKSIWLTDIHEQATIIRRGRVKPVYRPKPQLMVKMMWLWRYFQMPIMEYIILKSIILINQYAVGLFTKIMPLYYMHCNDVMTPFFKHQMQIKGQKVERWQCTKKCIL